MFKTVAIKKIPQFSASRGLISLLWWWHRILLSQPVNNSNRLPLPQCASHVPVWCSVCSDTREASAVVDREFLSHHAITDHRKINGGKNQYVCGRLNVASQPFIPPLAEELENYTAIFFLDLRDTIGSVSHLCNIVCTFWKFCLRNKSLNSW